MSKLKVYMAKHGIKREELVAGANRAAGKYILYPGKISLHHKGLSLEEEEKTAIMDWLKEERNLTPAKTTIF